MVRDNDITNYDVFVWTMIAGMLLLTYAAYNSGELLEKAFGPSVWNYFN